MRTLTSSSPDDLILSIQKLRQLLQTLISAFRHRNLLPGFSRCLSANSSELAARGALFISTMPPSQGLLGKKWPVPICMSLPWQAQDNRTLLGKQYAGDPANHVATAVRPMYPFFIAGGIVYYMVWKGAGAYMDCTSLRPFAVDATDTFEKRKSTGTIHDTQTLVKRSIRRGQCPSNSHPRSAKPVSAARKERSYKNTHRQGQLLFGACIA